MKDIEYVKPELPLMGVEEIPIDPWERRLAKQVNQDGHVHIFDDRVKINGPIDVWDIK